jgi:hypothetical protein
MITGAVVQLLCGKDVRHMIYICPAPSLILQFFLIRRIRVELDAKISWTETILL